MKPDAYMKWYWDTFWGAVIGMPDHVIVAYQRCISHYYHHNHTVGLDDNERKLREMCRATDKPDEVWEEIKGWIFDNKDFFFQDENGLWHQKRAHQEWNDAVQKYDAVVEKNKNAANKRWGNKVPPRRRHA